MNQAKKPPAKEQNDEKAKMEEHIKQVKDTLNEQAESRFEEQISQFTQEKEELQDENHRLSQYLLSLQRRNNGILEQLQFESAELEQKLEAKKLLFEQTKKQCQEEITQVQINIKKDYAEAEKVLIGHRKIHNHLLFNLNEKKEVDETRKSMIAQREKLSQELKEVIKDLQEKYNQCEHENIEKRRNKSNEEIKRLEELITEAKAQIDKEKIDTLREAESESKHLTIQVTKSQKVVAMLRDKYNKLLEEANELEMQMMEAKLVSQLTQPEQNQQVILKLQEERDRIEDEKIRARTKPEAENRRKMTQHVNSMKKKRNELSGFMKLNSLKHEEMEQLRALAMNVIEQRNALMTFLNETMTLIRHEIAASVDQKGLPFRTSELILCHVTENDQQLLGRTFASTNDTVVKELSEQLKFFEVLYSRFSGVPQPRKVEELI